MKIIIVGAGVSGLSTYLQLRKQLPAFSTHTVLIFESQKPRESSDTRASGPSLTKVEALTDSTAVVGNTIGLTSNGVRLLKYIDTELYETFKMRGYVSKTYKFKTARGHNLAVMSAGDGRSPEEFTISCPRYSLWRCLHEVVGEENIQHRKVVEVDLDGIKPIVRFENGGEEVADLVIGADGVRSVVKSAIFGEEDHEIYAPIYE
jgi:2-polyprenyl-6-methoxyphenol hydroxylase-like FAD-dependent oxidoreductase